MLINAALLLAPLTLAAPAPVPDALPEHDHFVPLASRQIGCVSNASNADALQQLLIRGGSGYVLRLCPGQVYTLDKPLLFNNTRQEISTAGYPTGAARATLVVGGDPAVNVNAIRGNRKGMDGCAIRHVQCDGNRRDGRRVPRTAGIIEMGGPTSGQVVEHVHSFDPRGWTCLHTSEGPDLNCRGMRVAHNQLGPAGFDDIMAAARPEMAGWSDGLSHACSNSLVENNYIVDATDGGIVVFGAPGGVIRNNTIVNVERQALGGIVFAQSPWRPRGNYQGLQVYQNRIVGPFATSCGDNAKRVGPNKYRALTKVGIAVGSGVTQSALQEDIKVFGMSIYDNVLTGGFSYGIAVSLARDVSVHGNRFENAKFFGTQPKRCFWNSTTIDGDGQHPHGPLPLIYYAGSTHNLRLQSDFQQAEAWYLICINAPESNANAWPYAEGMKC
ncbi:hypothetical protein CC85DRAFT_319115 [Cutaneotrichosporon oleaginosum]|uniref:Uncharacterized protein n=1 Tax=Cutaneotrichosporon oleaginosum TaxID=879819 RepID=A0A0J0XM22_9TREE|nr:uncharacterized protein CC85DRAFT_319115 [Cutaneotrichosporon oleaginosum]KLT42160.1 hypothetical protein CC85DRAFT_319115 [Cutaneotrichosporon oleaginosum]TXT11716.1 hypothetical protein COLE_02126 [Cutaneotrichosporon oleaginosum]